MIVLIAVCFALVVSLGLRALGDYLQHVYLGGWPIIQFALLLLVHGLAGLASWIGDPRTWGSRLMWMLAIYLHTVTYAINWPVYAGLVDAAQDHGDLLPTMAAVMLVIAPSILMFGGPIAALIYPRTRHGEVQL